jgi:oxygen-independent coproporphyrinogen III oxidase
MNTTRTESITEGPAGRFPKITEEVVHRYDVAGPRYTSYPTAPEWVEPPRFGPLNYAAKLSQAGEVDAPLSLYFHIPFCRQMCTYCGCNVIVIQNRHAADEYIGHLAMEMDLAAERLGRRRGVAQLHWGGGTPTFLGSEQIERLWSEITQRFQVLPNAEVSIEIDPVETQPEQLRVLRRLGFNRLSMGVQDFDPKVQATVRRIQTVEQTRAMLDEARSLGFSGINFDLIYGLPHQTPETWSRTIDQVISLRPDRTAVYSFAFVPDARPNQRALPAEALPRGTDKLELFRIAFDAFLDAGYRQVGMDHFALPEDELARAQVERRLTRNFQGYTVKAAGDVVAFGVTGISDVQGAYAQNLKPLRSYYAAVERGSFATVRGIELTPDDQRRRRTISDLMCHFAVDLGPDGTDYFAPELDQLRSLEADGFVRVRGPKVELTPLGHVFVRNVAMLFDSRLRQRQGAGVFSKTV